MSILLFIIILVDCYLMVNKDEYKLWCEAQQTPPPCCDIARFLGIDQKCNQVVPWSLRTFPENLMQISPAVFSYLADKETKKQKETKIQTNKSIENNTPSPI